MKVSEMIKLLRIEKNVSIETLAKAIGVNRRMVYYWESDSNEPKASYIIKLAEYFGVTTDYLLGVEK